MPKSYFPSPLQKQRMFMILLTGLRLISPAREQHACSSGLANVMSDSRPAFFRKS